MNEITIVTAFFDIGRKEYKILSRDSNKYLEYFKFWARIQNKIIIYTSLDMVEKVKRIRERFGLGDRTEVIGIKNIYDKEPLIYKRMKRIESKSEFLNFREIKDSEWPENKANYNYIVMMKYWFIHDAVKRGSAKGLVSWIDFGFNHGGECFSNPEEFDFLWKCEFYEKINIFCLKNPDNVLSVLQLQYLSDCIMSGVLIMPSKYAEELWGLIRNAMEALIMLDCIDDDQQLLLMAYKMNPELFEVHISNWFMPLKEHGGNHLSVTEIFANRDKTVNLKNRLIKRIGRIKRRIKYCKRTYYISTKYGR